MQSGNVSRGSFIRAAIVCATLALASCATPWYFRIDELRPTEISTAAPGPGGSFGTCLGAEPFLPFNVPLPDGQMLVGYDNWFEPGTEPLPCNRVRNSLWRAYVKFDLTPYDSIVSAFLLFDTVRSLDRPADADPNRTFAKVPGDSYATRVGFRASPQAIVNAVTLRNRRPVEASVSDHVNDWIAGRVANDGFVIANDSDVSTARPSDLSRTKDAQISWYTNFRLRVLYNVPDNPRTPQP